MAYYQYTVKYLCGEGDNVILAKGLYFTAINMGSEQELFLLTR
jgi:hypothetical protein